MVQYIDTYIPKSFFQLNEIYILIFLFLLISLDGGIDGGWAN